MDPRDNPLAWALQAACVPDDDDTPPTALESLFVEAGHSISQETWNTCVSCPVRPQCIGWAYDEDIRFGYFGGVSPTVRARYSYPELMQAIREGRLDRSGRVRPRR